MHSKDINQEYMEVPTDKEGMITEGLEKVITKLLIE